MGNRWNRIYVEKTRQYRQLSQQAKEIYAYLHGEQTDPAGVVVELREGETVNQAITHALGVPSKSRPRWRGAINDLVAVGFLFVDGAQVTLPNWRQRQEWGKRNGPKGPIPSPIQALESGTRTAGGCAEPRHDHDSDRAEPRHDHDSDCAEPRQRSEANGAESFNGASRNAAKILGQSRPGQAKKGAIGNHTARGGDPDGAEVLDIETGEIIDPDDFSDPPPEERERQHAELPPDEVTPEQADEGAELFDEVEEGEAF